MRRRRIRAALFLYGLIGIVAVVALWADDRPLAAHPQPWLEVEPVLQWLISIGLGLALAALVIVATRGLVERTQWAQELHIGFRDLLGPLRKGDILFFAVTSGVVEELFFRGAVQPWLGFVGASLLFGFVHLAPSRKFLPWTLWAIVMGFVFSALYQLTGQIAGCMVAHVLVNYENLHFIDSHDPSDAPRPRPTPGPIATNLVGAKERGGGSRSWH